jgi:hypothetical protein
MITTQSGTASCLARCLPQVARTIGRGTGRASERGVNVMHSPLSDVTAENSQCALRSSLPHVLWTVVVLGLRTPVSHEITTPAAV